MLLVVEMAQQQALDHEGDQAERHGRCQHADEERRAPGLGHGEGDVGAEHVEHAVREVDHPQHAEDQIEAGGDDEHVHGQREAIERVQREHREGHLLKVSPFRHPERSRGTSSCQRIDKKRSLDFARDDGLAVTYLGWMYSAGSIMR